MSVWIGKSFTRKLVGLLKLNLKLENTSGLLIQMPVGIQAYRIGGAETYPLVTKRKYEMKDLEVPYIPGSSFKGRMRSLLELSFGTTFYTTDGKIWQHIRSLMAMKFIDFENDVIRRDIINELFGWSSANYRQILEKAYEEKIGGSKTADEILMEAQVDQRVRKLVDDVNRLFESLSMTRLLVSDFFPTIDYINKHNVKSITDFLEEKPENRIDRITSAADPRDIVRVKPGVEFEGEVVTLFFNIDRDIVSKLIDTLLLGLKLIEETYIGSSGSRGYGRIKFTGEKVIVYKISSSITTTDILEKKYEKTFSSLYELNKLKNELIDTIVKELFQ